MIKLILYVLIMLTTTKKPFNPNRKYDGFANTNISTVGATDWDKSDLCGILHNIQMILQKDIKITGNDYKVTSSKHEIIAELIATMNLGHYNVLCGMRDIIKQNNNLINITKNSNKSVEYCEKTMMKKMNQIEIKLTGIQILLTQTLKILPDIPLNDFQSIIKAKNILDDISIIDSDSIKPRIDTIIIEPTHPTINASPEQTIELQTRQSNCVSENSSAKTRGQITLLKEPQSSHNKINKITAITATDIIDESHINTFDKTQSVIMPGHNKLLNKPQLKQKNKIIKPKNPSTKKTYKTQHKIQTKKKKKKKKKNYKNINKQNNKKKLKQQKNKKMNTTLKNNISNLELEEIIISALTIHQYQEWMKIYIYDNKYTATIHYEKTFGTSAINKIKQKHINDQS